MRRTLVLIGCFLSFAVPAVQAASIPSQKIPILVYHHIRKQEGWAKSTWSWKMTVSPAIFAKQMQWIADHGYTPVDMTTFADIIQSKKPGPAKPIVITFDDNNLNAYQNGLPVLTKHGFTAVFYIITNRLKNPNTIDEARVKDLVAKGMDIESHTVSHATLTALSIAKLDAELTQSKKTLEVLTGKPVLHLAYPSTAQNKTVREHVKLAGYVTATIMDPRPATAKDDLYKLPRIMMTDDTNFAKVLP